MPIPDLNDLETQILSLLSRKYKKSSRPLLVYRKTLIDEIKPTDFSELDKTVLNLSYLGYLSISSIIGSASWISTSETPDYSISMDDGQYIEFQDYMGKWDEDSAKMMGLLLGIDSSLKKPEAQTSMQTVVNFCKANNLIFEDVGYLIVLLQYLGHIETYGGILSDRMIARITSQGEGALRAYRKQVNLENNFSFLKGIKDPIFDLILREFRTLMHFKQANQWKYCVITAGSIIECLLIYFVELHSGCGIDLVNPNSRKGEEKSFNELLIEAENKNLFDVKRDWRFIRDHIRDFRNYVHLRKEVKEGYSVDESIYVGIESVLMKMINVFSKNW